MRLASCFCLFLFSLQLSAQSNGPAADFSITAQQFHKRMSAAEKAHILDGPFTEVTKTEVMPVRVKQAFAKITGEPSFALANPRQKYQATDFVVDRKLPVGVLSSRGCMTRGGLCNTR
jgi:hypothetical protein